MCLFGTPHVKKNIMSVQADRIAYGQTNRHLKTKIYIYTLDTLEDLFIFLAGVFRVGTYKYCEICVIC